MQQLPFPIIDPHIHQWDPYNTPHAAALAVKLFGNHPKLLDRMVRLLKPRDAIETIGLTQHLTAPYLPANYKKDAGHYEIEQIVHVEASWHDHKGTGVVNETRFIAGLPFDQHTIQLGGIVATADPRQKNFKQLIELYREASPKFRGIRKMAAVHSDKGIHAWTDEPHLYRNKYFLKGFEELARQDLSFDAWVYSPQITDVTALAKAFPTPLLCWIIWVRPQVYLAKWAKLQARPNKIAPRYLQTGKISWQNWPNAKMYRPKCLVCLCQSWDMIFTRRNGWQVNRN